MNVAKGLKRDYTKQFASHDKRELYVLAEFEYAGGRVQRECVTFVPWKHLDLQDIKPEVKIEEDEENFRISLSAEGFVPFVWLDLKESDAFFSDNAFDLHRGRPVTITVRKDSISGNPITNVEAFTEQLSVYTLRGSYV